MMGSWWKPQDDGSFRGVFVNAEGGRHYMTIEAECHDVVFAAREAERIMASRGYDRPLSAVSRSRKIIP